jgi:hypothetical protein
MRPELPPDQLRSRMICVRANEEEYAKWLSVGAVKWLRPALKRAKPVPPKQPRSTP